jgi:uncharacterized protein YjbJ (UPF0337 family)
VKRPRTTYEATTGILGIRKGEVMGQQEERGKVKKLQGRGKEIVGILTGDSALELEGDQDQIEGEVQESLGKARRKVGELVAGAAKAIKK